MHILGKCIVVLSMVGLQPNLALSQHNLIVPIASEWTSRGRAEVGRDWVKEKLNELLRRFIDPVTKTPLTETQFKRIDGARACHDMALINPMFRGTIEKAEKEIDRDVLSEVSFYNTLVSEYAEFDKITDAFCGFVPDQTLPAGESSKAVVTRLSRVRNELARAAQSRFSRSDRSPERELTKFMDYGLASLNAIREELVDSNGRPRTDFTSPTSHLQLSYQMGYSSMVVGIVQMKQMMRALTSGIVVERKCQDFAGKLLEHLAATSKKFVLDPNARMPFSDPTAAADLLRANASAIQTLTEFKAQCSID